MSQGDDEGCRQPQHQPADGCCVALQTTDVKEDYILVIDADMIMREPFIPEDVGGCRACSPGLSL